MSTAARMRAAQATLRMRHRSFRGEPVTLLIDGNEISTVTINDAEIDIVAVPAQTRLKTESQQSAGFTPVGITTDCQDWLIEAAHYVNADGQAVQPKAGDVIVDGDGDQFEALPLGEQSEVWAYRGNGESLRVHTKRINAG